MTTSTQTRRSGLTLNLRAMSYLLRVVLLLAALGVVIATFGGGVYVALALALSAAALFVTGIAPGLLPNAIHAAAQTPFLLGLLIPGWALVEAILQGSGGLLPEAVRSLALYGGAVLILFVLPRWMRAPFAAWLPEGAVPPETAKARREKSARTRRSKESAGPARESRRGPRLALRRGGKKQDTSRAAAVLDDDDGEFAG
ncbi:MAG: hypothetical protein JW910_20630 [Anaerolineae bacterium]|nr:hypothetical protein [Anaerolineae bacterium]